MKKVIICSIIASSLLMSVEVNNLNIEQASQISTDVSVIDSIGPDKGVHQAKTQITGSSTVVENLTITQIEDGNVINNETTIENAQVIQGQTKIISSKVSDVGLDSDSKITNSQINNSTIWQSYFYAKDANSTDSTANDIDVQSTNIIDGVNINNYAGVGQGLTGFWNGAKVSGLDLRQKNTLNHESSVDGSILLQGYTVVHHNSELENLSSTWGYGINSNTVSGTSMKNNYVLQNYVEINTDAIVKDISNGSSNLIKDSILEDTEVTQNGIGITSSNVDTIKQYRRNKIQNVDASNESRILQNTISIENAASVKNITSYTLTTNDMNNIEVSGSTLSQNEMNIVDATVDGIHAIQTNLINNAIGSGTTDNNISSSSIIQGITMIEDSTVTNLVQGANNAGGVGNNGVVNEVKDVDLDYAEITQASTEIEDSTVTNLSLDQRNGVDATNMDNATLNQGMTTIN